MIPAPAPRVVRFERTAALALAAAAATAPSVVGVALAVLAVLPGNAIWAVACGFAAGAVAGRGDRRVGATVAFSLLAWAGASLMESPPPAEHLYLFGRPAPQVAYSEYAYYVSRVIAACSAAAAFLAGWRPGGFGLLASAALALTAAAVLRLSRPAHDAVSPADALLAALALVVALLGRLRRDVAAVVLLGVAMAACVAVRHWLRSSSDVLGTAVAVMLLPLAYLAGAFAADLEEGVAADEGTRLVVLAQRRPWATSVAIAAVIVGAGGPWAADWYGVRDPVDVATALVLVPVAFAFLAHAGRGGRTGSDRLAPWLATNSAALVAALVFAAAPWWNLQFASTLAMALPIALWPLVCGVLLPGDPPGDETPFAVVAFALTLCLFPLAATWIVRPADAWATTTALSVLLVPLAFHAAVRSRLRSGTIVLASLGVGVLGEALRPSAVWFSGSMHASPFRTGLLVPAVWLCAGVLAVAARRCRSMTAVPRDHPIVEDFRVE